jgi:hypothetical protein
VAAHLFNLIDQTSERSEMHNLYTRSEDNLTIIISYTEGQKHALTSERHCVVVPRSSS